MAQGTLGTVLEPGEGHYGNLEVLSGWSGGSGTATDTAPERLG